VRLSAAIRQVLYCIKRVVTFIFHFGTELALSQVSKTVEMRQ